MENFPIKALKPRHAVLFRCPDDSISIEILMVPFLFAQEIIDTSICLDGVDLPSDTLRELAGKSFDFPVNPSDGYIDGSIYLGTRHHPVNVTSLNFIESRRGELKVIAKGIYELNLDGLGSVSTPFTLVTVISSCAV
jgi:hypothetical protein